MAIYQSSNFDLDTAPPAIGGSLSVTSRDSDSVLIDWTQAATDSNWTDDAPSTPRAGYELYLSTLSQAEADAQEETGSCFLWNYIDDAVLDTKATQQTDILISEGSNAYMAMFLRDDFTNLTPAGSPVLFCASIPPAIPTNCVAAAQSNFKVYVTWDHVGTPDSFKIERKTGPGGGWGIIDTVAGTIKEYNDNEVQCNTQYYYRIKAHDDIDGDSLPSNEDETTTLNHIPQTVEAEAQSNTTIRVTWVNQSTDWDIEIYGAEDDADPGSFTLQGTEMAGSTYGNIGSLDNRLHFYAYRTRYSKDVDQKGNWSDIIIVPRATGDLAGEAFSYYNRLTWTDDATNETSWEIWREVNDGGWAFYVSRPANTTEYDDYSVGIAKYEYRVFPQYTAGGRAGKAWYDEVTILRSARVPLFDFGETVLDSEPDDITTSEFLDFGTVEKAMETITAELTSEAMITAIDSDVVASPLMDVFPGLRDGLGSIGRRFRGNVEESEFRVLGGPIAREEAYFGSSDVDDSPLPVDIDGSLGSAAIDSAEVETALDSKQVVSNIDSAPLTVEVTVT